MNQTRRIGVLLVLLMMLVGCSANTMKTYVKITSLAHYEDVYLTETYPENPGVSVKLTLADKVSFEDLVKHAKPIIRIENTDNEKVYNLCSDKLNEEYVVKLIVASDDESYLYLYQKGSKTEDFFEIDTDDLKAYLEPILQSVQNQSFVFEY
ncbi:MAG: hypothetical protein RR565_06670 [Erysipelothrix sp.]